MKLLTKRGDTLIVIYDPKSEPLEVGDALEIMEPGGKRGVIAQVADIGPLDLPGVLTHVIRMETIGAPAQVYAEEEFSGIEAKIMNMSHAVCKVRKEIKVSLDGIKRIEDWSGYSPPRESAIRKIGRAELSKDVIGRVIHRIVVGEDEEGKEIAIDAYYLQGVNIIAGKKGTGKSHEAKTILLGLIDNGAQAVVFDINDEYSGLRFKEDGEESEYHDKLVCLTPGEDLMFTLSYIGLEVFSRALSAIGLPETSLLAVRDLWDRLSASITLENFEEELDSDTSIHSKVRSAIKLRLATLKGSGVITDDPQEATRIEDVFSDRLKDGGALIINLKGQGRLTMLITVQTILSKLKELLEADKLERGRIFMFAEEAHFYLEEADWVDIVTLMRHLGLWQFYITNTPSAIPELIIRQADNLFLFHLDLEDDIRRIAQSRGMDYETATLMARSMPPRTFALIGTATSDYPIRLKTIPLSVKTAGETKVFFKKP